MSSYYAPHDWRQAATGGVARRSGRNLDLRAEKRGHAEIRLTRTEWIVSIFVARRILAQYGSSPRPGTGFSLQKRPKLRVQIEFRGNGPTPLMLHPDFVPFDSADSYAGHDSCR